MNKLFKNDYIIMDVNLVGRANPRGVLEIGAVRIKNNTVIGKYESIVRLDNLDNWPEATWKDHGIEKIEVAIAPVWNKVCQDLLGFCSQGEVTSWSGQSIMYSLHMMTNEGSKYEGVYWAYKLEIRSYLSALCGKLLSRDLKKVLEEHGLDTKQFERPLVRCKSLLQLIEVIEEQKQIVNEEYTLFEV